MREYRKVKSQNVDSNDLEAQYKEGLLNPSDRSRSQTSESSMMEQMSANFLSMVSSEIKKKNQIKKT